MGYQLDDKQANSILVTSTVVSVLVAVVIGALVYQSSLQTTALIVKSNEIMEKSIQLVNQTNLILEKQYALDNAPSQTHFIINTATIHQPEINDLYSFMITFGYKSENDLELMDPHIMTVLYDEQITNCLFEQAPLFSNDIVYEDMYAVGYVVETEPIIKNYEFLMNAKWKLKEPFTDMPNISYEDNNKISRPIPNYIRDYPVGNISTEIGHVYFDIRMLDLKTKIVYEEEIATPIIVIFSAENMRIYNECIS